MKTSQWSLPVISRAGRPIRYSPRHSAARAHPARGAIIAAPAVIGLTAVAALGSFQPAASHNAVNAANAGTVSAASSHPTGYSNIYTGWMW